MATGLRTDKNQVGESPTSTFTGRKPVMCALGGAGMEISCWDCGHEIEDNDDAYVCIQCGGMNLRSTPNRWIKADPNHAVGICRRFLKLLGGVVRAAYPRRCTS